MSGLLSSGSVSKTSPAVSSLRVATSTYGRALPLAWGLVRVTGFALWFGDFRSVAHEQDVGGKGGGGSISNYTYEAALAVGLAEARAAFVPTIWSGTDRKASASTAAATVERAEWLTVGPAGGATIRPPAAVDAVVSVERPVGWSGWEAVAYTRTGNLITVDTALAGTPLRVVYRYTMTGPVAPTADLNLSVISGSDTQAAWSHLATNHPAEADAFRGIAYLASPVFQLGSQPDVPNLSAEIDTGHGFSTTIRDANPRDVIADVLLHPTKGAGFRAEGLGSLDDYSAHCIAAGLFLSPDYTEQTSARDILARIAAITNAAWSCTDGELQLTPLTEDTLTGNGVTWEPDLTASYELTEDHFIPAEKGGPPLTIRRKAPADRYNVVRVNFRDRANEYNDATIERADDADIAAFGRRESSSSVDASEIKTAAIAQRAGDLLVQRSVNIARTFTGTLPMHFALLKPDSVVALTVPSLGLSQQLARVTKMTESGWRIACEFEEMQHHAAGAIDYPAQPGGGYVPPVDADPSDIASPMFIEPPRRFAQGTGLSLWIAAGSTAANWGGCTVWISYDGTTYTRHGTIKGGARYGQTIAPMSASGGTCDLELTAGGTISGATPADARLLSTLCMVGGEAFAFGGAELLSAGRYRLTSLKRAAYETRAQAWPSGTPVARLDAALLRSDDLDRSHIGETLHFKFTSFNLYGLCEQSLADVAAYTYTVTGQQAVAVAPPPSNFSAVAGASGVELAWVLPTDGAGNRRRGTVYVERAADAAGLPGAWSLLGTCETTGLLDPVTDGSRLHYRARFVDLDENVSGYTPSLVVIASAGHSGTSGGALGVSVSPATLYKPGRTLGTIRTAPAVATVTDASGALSYAWTRISGSALVNVDTPAAASTTFSHSAGVIGDHTATFACAATDAAGSSGTDTVTVTISITEEH